jgi:hypothetical protein
VLAAQHACARSDNDWARLWPEIAPCLGAVSGPANARQTRDYVRLIARRRAMMGE